MDKNDQDVTLARKITFPLLLLYGLGTILGAGVYVLIGKVAGSAGMLAPLAFLIAAIIAWLTAKSYASLAVLFPRCAGEALYMEKSFGRRWLTILVGLLIILTALVSAGTLTRGFVGYFVLLVPVGETVAIVGVLALLTTLAIWGIAESLTLAAIVTLVEVAGLLIVLWFCGSSLADVPDRAPELFIPTSLLELTGVFAGAFLAFYAFIGFEDMVNVVEEVRKPAVTMPRAILWAVILSTCLYMLIALVAILSMPIEALEQSSAPLADILQDRSQAAAKAVAIISIFAIINGALIQIIMASRVCYGMSRNYGGPAILHKISPSRRTPVYATLLMATLVLLATLYFPLIVLAKITSFVILVIFTLINIALWKMKREHFAMADPQTVQQIAGFTSFPLLAAGLCVMLLLMHIASLI